MKYFYLFIVWALFSCSEKGSIPKSEVGADTSPQTSPFAQEFTNDNLHYFLTGKDSVFIIPKGSLENPQSTDCRRPEALRAIDTSYFIGSTFEKIGYGQSIEYIPLANDESITIENSGCEGFTMLYHVKFPYDPLFIDVKKNIEKALFILSNITSFDTSAMRIDRRIEDLKCLINSSEFTNGNFFGIATERSGEGTDSYTGVQSSIEGVEFKSDISSTNDAVMIVTFNFTIW